MSTGDIAKLIYPFDKPNGDSYTAMVRLNATTMLADSATVGLTRKEIVCRLSQLVSVQQNYRKNLGEDNEKHENPTI